jgi:transcriptional regulator with PAS, ATPase and Fis domain
VENLVESELFGYVRGAFTGANQDKVGLFEHADGGIIFLDEIGELAPAAQAKLLRVLQNRQVQRVGSLTPRNIDVRVIAATHRNLRTMVNEGQFREDLYYRLGVVEIMLPLLSDRREDLPLLEILRRIQEAHCRTRTTGANPFGDLPLAGKCPGAGECDRQCLYDGRRKPDRH